MTLQRVCADGDVSIGTCRPFRVEGRDVVVWRFAEDEYYCLHRWCSHLEEGLEHAAIDEEELWISCRRHEARFSLETGETDTALFATDIAAYEVQVLDGALFIDIPDDVAAVERRRPMGLLD